MSEVLTRTAADPVNEREARLIEFLRELAKLSRGTVQEVTAVMVDFILEHGRFCTPAERPRNVRPVKLAASGRVSQKRVLRRDSLLYVEGFALTSHLGPRPLAWCVRSDGTVIDPTCDEGCYAYFGVPFERHEVAEHVEANAKHPGPLINLKYLDKRGLVSDYVRNMEQSFTRWNESQSADDVL
jgi:hypothetical protein